jgi:serine/threonine protein kinase
MAQQLCKDVILWKRLSHPNIIPLLGASIDDTLLYTVSKWMNQGTIVRYLRSNPGANRRKLVGPAEHVVVYVKSYLIPGNRYC